MGGIDGKRGTYRSYGKSDNNTSVWPEERQKTPTTSPSVGRKTTFGMTA